MKIFLSVKQAHLKNRLLNLLSLLCRKKIRAKSKLHTNKIRRAAIHRI